MYTMRQNQKFICEISIVIHIVLKFWLTSSSINKLVKKILEIYLLFETGKPLCWSQQYYF